MPHCTVLIDQRGPILNAHIGISEPRKAAMVAAGLPVPPHILVSLLIDTGAGCTCIDASVIAKLGLQATSTTPVYTPSTGSVPHILNNYDIELVIPTKDSPVIIPAHPVLDGNYMAQGHHGLLGRDVLSRGRLYYSGPDMAAMISF
jgi:predicted aspartyl protease